MLKFVYFLGGILKKLPSYHDRAHKRGKYLYRAINHDITDKSIIT